jgi:hypothetical protein
MSSFLLSVIISVNATAQPNAKAADELSAEMIQSIFPDSLREELKILYPIKLGYQFTDRSGQFIYLLTEEKSTLDTASSSHNQKIKAIALKTKDGKLYRLFEIRDNIISSGKEEDAIWFWTKYITFRDSDEDGLIDPIIVYGSSALNGTDDGRINIIVCHKGLKIAIRHQNGMLDFERETRVDKTFYSLPVKIQEAVKEIIGLIIKDGNAIFPFGWQKAMNNKLSFFSER